MMRLNLLLLLALLVSAFFLVNMRYESRRLHSAISQAKAQKQRLEAEYEQLVAQKRVQAATSRVQQAASQLQMKPATPAVTEYVQGGGRP